MKIRPLYDRILVKRLESPTKTKSGLFLPETASEKPFEGEVLAVGGGSSQENGEIRPLMVNVGDHVMFGKYAGTEIKLDGEERLILKESDVLGVVE